MPLSVGIVKIGVSLIAFFCALIGLFTIYYGYTAIYTLSGFTSIFIGVATILIAIGLIKRHNVARIGAYFILLISSFGYVLWLIIVFRTNENVQISDLGLLEYICIIYILLATIAICFLSIKSTSEYFSLNKDE
jgi:hypothetical protein